MKILSPLSNTFFLSSNLSRFLDTSGASFANVSICSSDMPAMIIGDRTLRLRVSTRWRSITCFETQLMKYFSSSV